MPNLDKYRPDPETFHGVRRQLVTCGIPPDQIPDQWVEATIAAMARWLRTTPQGAATGARIMGLEAAHGRDDKEYIWYPDEGPREIPIKPENISFFRGAMVNNVLTSMARIEIRDKAEDNCEGCGIIGPCTKPVLDSTSQNLDRLCNACIRGSDDPKIYDEGDSEMCGRCPKVRCSNHPRKQLAAPNRRHIG